MFTKKSILSAILIASLSTTTFALSGTPYIGVLAGVNSNPNSSHIQVDKITPIGVFAGYGARVGQRGYLGAELSADYFLGFSIMPGFMLTDHTMLYGRVGSASTYTKNKFTDDKTFVTGERVGIGMQTNVIKKIDIRGEYDYTNFPERFGTTSQINSFNVSLIYKFD
jgi:opacity protein-like surface antigen